MDRTDIRILQALQRDGRLSNQRLAEVTGISPAACWRRVRALEESGVIAGYAALLDRTRVKLNLCAYIHITLARHVRESTAPFEEAIRQRPEVMECFVTTGDADFILRVVTERVLRPLPGGVPVLDTADLADQVQYRAATGKTGHGTAARTGDGGTVALHGRPAMAISQLEMHKNS